MKDKKSYKKKAKSLTDKFLETYATNIYLNGMEYDLPDWVFDYREELIHKVTQNGKKLYAKLSEMGVDFKIRFPYKNLDKWKFADALLPKYKLIILLMNFRETVMPVCSMYDRVGFFNDRYKCIMILPEEIDGLDVILKEKGLL